MDNDNILRLILQNPEQIIDPAWVSDMLSRYPAFYFPAALLVRRCRRRVSADMLQRLYTAIALNCPDREAIAAFANIGGSDWRDFYPKKPLPQESSTDLTIETFINTYGKSSPQEDALLERLIFSPVPADYLAGADEPYDPADPLALPPELQPGYTAPADEESTIIDTPDPTILESDRRVSPDITDSTPVSNTIPTPPPFVGLRPSGSVPPPFTGLHNTDCAKPTVPEVTQKSAAHKPAKEDTAPSEDTTLMESLSKFFIKKGRYERAYDIISKLSLKYPEKSVYFAEQLRYLQKLIINQKINKENKTKISE